jgi:hypothetical protein
MIYSTDPAFLAMQKEPPTKNRILQPIIFDIRNIFGQFKSMFTVNPWKLYTLVAFVALAVRLPLVYFFQDDGGDTALYETVALNILNNACVSMSSPLSGACVPHWGGNQLPGYPLFLAAVWSIFGKSALAANAAQAVIWTAAVCYLVSAVWRLTDSWIAALAVGMVMALSPLQIPWVRMTLTESLTFTTTLWVFAELVFSLASRQLRVLPLAIALAAAIFIRYDQIFLCFAVAVVGFYLHGAVQAIQRGLLIALLVAVPLLVWTVRNIAVGLDVVPHAMTLEDGTRPPMGYFAWGNTWTTNQYQYPAWNYPVFKNNFEAIRIDKQVYASSEEKVEVEKLLIELKSFQLQSFPAHIDQRFAELAAARVATNSIWYHVGLPAVRTWNTWFNPRNSAGWPVKVPSLKIGKGTNPDAVGLAGLIELTMAHPVSALTRGITALYRIGLLAGLTAALVLSARAGLGYLRPLVWAAGIVTLGRIILYASFDIVETRYALGSVPGIEIALCLMIVYFLPFTRPNQ